jgi:predicted DNA-binding transcriptional regulator YafY
MSEGVPLSRTTFHRHRIAIEEIFGLYIDCDRNNGYKYSIGNRYVLQENSVQNWMLSTLSVSSTVSDSLALKDRILLEPVSSGHDYLSTVIDAMRRSVRIKVAYQRYGADKSKDLCFEPYCIKLFNRRWYVLGHYQKTDPSDNVTDDFYGVFAFDRIRGLSLTDIKFTIDPDFDAEAYFEECFGVVVHDDTMVERVVIRAFGQERFYLKDLPLHHSQREIARGDDYTDFELTLRPTMDFCNCLLSHGCHIKVLSPERLALEIFEMHAEATRLYGIDAKGFYE